MYPTVTLHIMKFIEADEGKTTEVMKSSKKHEIKNPKSKKSK